MANTVSLLSYANTFGDWVVTTNALVRENNDLAANNYTKAKGTLTVGNILTPGTTVFNVLNDAVVGGQLQVQGTGSSARIQNNLTVTQGQVYFQNTTLGLTNTGELISNGIISAAASGIGLAVANNTTIGGYLRVTSNTNLANTLSVTGAATLSNTLAVTGAATLSNTLFVASNATFGGNVTIANYNTTNDLFSNNSTNTSTLAVRSNASVSGTLSVVGSTFVNTLQSNNLIRTVTLGVSGKAFVDYLQANSSMNTATATIADTLWANNIIANTSLSIPTLSVTSAINAPFATLSANSVTVGTGGLSVLGNFTINGTTVYNTPIFTLSANTPNQTSYFGVYRSPGANAYIKWDQANTYWSIADVSANSYYYRILTTKELSDSVTSTSIITGASSNAANILNNNINTANTFLRLYTDTANTSLKSYVDANVTSLQNQITSNTASLQSQISSNVSSLQNQISSNVAIISGVDSTQNTYINFLNVFAQAAFNKANTGSGTFNGTTGQAISNNGMLTFASNNGVVISGTANSLYINTSQNLRTSDSPTFNGLTLTNALPLAQGGTGSTSAAGALTTLLPTGTTSGYVLTTGGPGTFYWAAGGSGGSGGATPGTTINSTRLSYAANGSGLSYTTPVYVPGASQLRVYVDGVRQFASEYTETTGNTGGIGIVTFSSSPPGGSAILVEVDGYIINPYYANNIAFTVNSTISPTANTIQLAVDGLTSIVALKTGATFTGPTMAPTAAVGVSNTQIATTAYVNSLANSGITFAHSITGLATTATTASVANALNTGNNYQINSLGVNTTASGTAGEIRATNNITAYYSDDRLKTRLGNIQNALSKVMSLNGFHYEANETAQALGYTVKPEVGVSAQEVQAVLPEVVVPAPIDAQYLTVHYDKLVPLLIEAIKELKAEIDTLKGSK